MTLNEIRSTLEKRFVGTITESEHMLTFSCLDVAFNAHIYHGMFYFTLTKKEPREAIYGVTTISFTGLGEETVEPAFQFIIERMLELI